MYPAHRLIYTYISLDLYRVLQEEGTGPCLGIVGIKEVFAGANIIRVDVVSPVLPHDRLDFTRACSSVGCTGVGGIPSGHDQEWSP